MHVLVVGATGGSGRAAVAELTARGHTVTALSRHASALTGPGVRGVGGDATDPAVVDALVAGQDAVVVTLGISETPVRVRLRGPVGTPADVRSRGTRVVVDAMRRHGVRRLVVQTSYGVGSTRSLLPFTTRLVFALLLAPQIADTERQATLVHTSGLDWVEVQPVNLVDTDLPGAAFTSTTGEQRGLTVSRTQVGQVLADAVETDAHVGRTVSVSHDTAVRAAA
ncbi:NAD-dependent epimerase/dehydratase [Cellulomonas flavigena DSM 20109]|uniref:NAD-dependent epimerase/dehydratase n=1 Tax=Cellulomonas flavigena (strain ATCC 482 / DSM 20109 / BCRC 11376 / JCM 18109 / NBRC 3775 / NCIMB 8073 / NRS 134) TaxID=446466 RepID=D5UHK7_CELFN|nr:NAD(P)-binding oxidoreductase [Cellulomonas flavigena]ADG75328.1 NAD-dependent epimerase/dehydratase [Cellulomonas flavigena DSM 20109]